MSFDNKNVALNESLISQEDKDKEEHDGKENLSNFNPEDEDEMAFDKSQDESFQYSEQDREEDEID